MTERRVHLDTDFAGDPDDACALVMLLGWPGVEITGITTTADPDGRRAGYLAHLLALAGRSDIPIAAGAATSVTTGLPMGDISDPERYWGASVPARRSTTAAALDLLDRSIDQGATIIAIGPYTNLALLETRSPGRLRDTTVVAMGGWIDPLGVGLPAWGPARDWNVQCDTEAALVVTRRARVTLVTLAATVHAHLRVTHVPRLVAAGPIGHLLANQAEAYATDTKVAALAAAHDGLPDDLLNFHHDPLTCAVAIGWDGVIATGRLLRPVMDNHDLYFVDDPGGVPITVVSQLTRDFTARWQEAVEQAARNSTR